MKKMLTFFSWGPGKVAEGRDGGCKQAAQRQSQSAVFTSFPLWGKAGMGQQTNRPEAKPVITPLGGVYLLSLVGESRDGGSKQTAQRQSQSLRRLAVSTSFPLWGKAGMEVANKSPRDKASIYPVCRPPA